MNVPTTQRPGGGGARRFARQWLLPLLALATVAAVLVSIFLSLRRTVWSYYTDGLSIREPVVGTEARAVLWEEPGRAFGDWPADADDPEPAFSPDDARVAITLGLHARTNADLFLACWDGRAWTNLPAPSRGSGGQAGVTALGTVNTESNHEVSPAFSRDNRCLYFASDRPGGFGGYDLWVALWDGTNWANATNLGASVNSRFDDRDPAPSPDGKRLFFASNRPFRGPGGGGYDLYAADAICEAGTTSAVQTVPRIEPPAPKARGEAKPRKREGRKTEGKRSEGENGRREKAETRSPTRSAVVTAVSNVVSSAPVFGEAEPVPGLCSPADDVQPVFTARGDALYFASNRRGGWGGYDLYASRVLGRRALPPRNLGLEINSEADDTAPAVRMEGFDLLFSSNRGQADKGRYALFASVSREVVEGLDLTRWNLFASLLDRIKWWVLVAAAALALLVYLLRHYRDLTNLFHRCLMVSAILHLILLLCAAFWIISAELIGGMEPKTMEVTLDVNALAREKLALNMRDQVTELPPSDVSLVMEQTKDPVPMPNFTPRVLLKLPPIVTRSHDESLVTFVTPSKASEATKAPAAAKSLDRLPAIPKPVAEIALEEPEPATEAKPEKEAEVFDPASMLAKVRVEFQPQRRAVTKPVSAAVGPQDVTAAATTDATATGQKVRDTGGSRVVASAGLEAKGQLPQLTGSGDIAGLLVKSGGKGTQLRMDAPGKLDVPSSVGGSISPQILANPGKLSTEIVEELGGSGATQGAIGRALEWFTRNQEPDGRWDIRKHGGQEGHDVAATSLALLCYYGWGARHSEDGPYREVVKKALDWLLKQMRENGDLRGGNERNGMYDHGMAAIALCEAYGVTRDPKLLEPAQKAVQFVCEAQDKRGGGWRYRPGDAGDLSVFGWQYMALRSAELAGLEVPKETWERAEKWLNGVAGGESGGIYGYQQPARDRPAMIPTGMFCRQLAKVPPEEPRMAEGAGFMRVKSPFAEKRREQDVDYYYLYYGTLALYQHQGPAWEEWNNRMKDVLTVLQNKTGPEAGSWTPSNAAHGKDMGRAVTTALATLSLEVYYRLLPIYGFRGPGEKPK